MKLNCLALSCSPRKDGNTAYLAGQALEQYRQSGHKTELLYIVDYNYAPCKACLACEKTGRCVVKDDAGIIFDKILDADRFILAAPVYSMGICAQAKMLIDRAQQFWALKYKLGQNVITGKNRPQRQGIFISCAGTTLPGVFDGALRVTKYFFKMLEIDLKATLCYDGVDKKGDILNHEKAVQEVCEAARE